jgi:PAS domain S-box-containing protein
MANDRRIMEENRTEAIEEHVSYPDGTVATWLSTKAPLRDPDGLVIGLIGSSLDISERKRAEDQLRRSEARLRFLGEMDDALRASRDAPAAMLTAAELLARQLEASRCAYADVNADNNQFVIRADYTAPGIASSAGTYSLDLFGPRAAQDMRAGRTLVIRNVSGELAPGEGRETFHSIGIEAIVCCPLLKEDRLVAMMAVHQTEARDWQDEEIDLIQTTVERCRAHVERISAEARLRESEERLRLATESAEIGFWDVDVLNDVLIWPARVKAMFGISPDVPVTMQDFYDGLHPDDRGRTAAAYEAAADPARRELYDVEYRTVGKEDGQIRWVAAKGRGVFDDEGRCVRMIGVAIDITRRKGDEERLRELNEDLERRVEEAVAERAKTEEQLRQSQKMEAVGQLTGGIAHDFNNLLTGVIGSLDMMQRRIAKGETDKIERYATTAMTAANRAAALTHRLLAFARRQPLDPKPVNANRLVTGMEELLRRTIGETIALEIVTAGGLWQTLCDPHQLESAILNLAINARDAMLEGGKLTIETCNARLDDAYAARQREVKPGQYICICVTDTGTGMTPDVIAKAFEPFFTTKPIGQGTGLGLSMIYGFARQSEGYARIYSEVERGTTIKLYLPRYYGESEDSDAERAGLTEAHRSEDGEVVLVVEDEAAVRDLVIDVLQDLGYKAVEASDGPGGLKILQSELKLDLLITDVGLPGLNGRQLADAARKHRPELKVLFMTGYAENATVANGFLEPGMQMITKPFAIEALATRIRDMIERV